ncbi:tripartite tricarboxylate transporter substrate binding protein [Rhodovarius crocodyli]|uniref:Tripartite tricarboxylate transporter substrate binding protein n=1 Tax=Rhodovarius crocodyli TaxID=1979269 RepID=A0A437MG06_9PROT|nr:tripartite tricarboxylate transporter substrate binding protein [Rhodovarius crocodyli]RVT96593.1 tripartite tricarboxylate transporter substrate binding protein [Rhodovarius crocodyli]
MHHIAIGRRLLLGSGTALALPNLGRAQGLPARPIRLIVPFSAGGSTDVHMRVLADVASRRFGQTVIIENRPGASGSLGMTAMRTAAADGLTLTTLPITAVRNMLMTGDIEADPTRDCAPVLHLTGYLLGVVVRRDAPWQTWQEFLAYAKANPDKINYGTAGAASTPFIGMERIAREQGIRWTHVPYRGVGENVQALMSGQIHAAADSSGWAPMVEDGTFRLLVTWGAERPRRFAQAPTLKETGTNLVFASPYGLVGPRGMSADTVKALHDGFKDALLDERHVQTLERLDMPVMYKGTEEYRSFLAEQVAEERDAVRSLGLRG